MFRSKKPKKEGLEFISSHTNPSVFESEIEEGLDWLRDHDSKYYSSLSRLKAYGFKRIKRSKIREIKHSLSKYRDCGGDKYKIYKKELRQLLRT